MRRYKLLYILSLLPLFSCRHTHIHSEAPESKPATKVYQPKLSVINVPVSFSVKQLETKLNTELPQSLFKDDNLKGGNLKVSITRSGKLSIKAQDSFISFSIPLHIRADGHWEWKACSFCPTLGKSESTEFDLTVNTKSMVSMTPDWKLKTQTMGSYEWGNKRPFIELGPIKMPLSGIIDLAMKPQMAQLSSKLDEEIQNRINIKDYISKAWTEVQKPILLDKNAKAWLVVQPQEVQLSPVAFQAGEMNFKVGIKSLMEVRAGTEPVVQPKALPALVSQNEIADNSQIGLAADIPYDYASNVIKDQTKAKTYSFENGNYTLQVLDAALSYTEDKLVLRLNIAGTSRKGKNVDGQVFLTGIPYYDIVSGSIKVRDFDFDVKTKNLLLKTAAWVANVGFQKQLQDQFNFPVKDRLEELRKSLQNALVQNGRITDNLLLKGEILKLEPEGIFLNKTSMTAVVNAEGKVNVTVDKL